MISKLDAVITALTSEEEFSPKWTKFLSLFFLLVSCSVTFVTFTKPSWYFFTKEFTLQPGVIETIIGLSLVAPLYLRNILKWSMSIYGIISFILILLVFSSFITFAEGGDSSSSITQLLIFTALLISWLGIRPLPGFSWVLVFISAIYNIITTNAALDFLGFVYLASGFLGLILHSGLNPGNLYKEISTDFSKSWKNTKTTRDIIQEDMQTIRNKIAANKNQ